MKVVGVIPARYASTRFPGKPLANDTGKYLIQHVYERVQTAQRVNEVIVATDDDRIANAVESFGGRSIMTRPDHESGTDRVAEVARELDADVVVNVQGDEPEIEPAAIDDLIGLMINGECPVATLACPFEATAADPADPNNVKVAVSQNRAIYFSRAAIPFQRNRGVEFAGPYLHLGLYAYLKDFLLAISSMPVSPLERIEGLEQLRIIENGYSIAAAIVDRAFAGIDTPGDYDAFAARYRANLAESSTKS